MPAFNIIVDYENVAFIKLNVLIVALIFFLIVFDVLNIKYIKLLIKFNLMDLKTLFCCRK